MSEGLLLLRFAVLSDNPEVVQMQHRRIFVKGYANLRGAFQWYRVMDDPVRLRLPQSEYHPEEYVVPQYEEEIESGQRGPTLQQVLELCGASCAICGSGNFLQIDHIIPVSHGGKTIVSNLQVLCKF